MLRMLLRALLWVVAGWVALCVLAFLLQRRFQYFPDPTPVKLPEGGEGAGIREVELEASDGVRLQAWFWPGERDRTLLVFHGNAGHRGDRLGWMTGFHDLGWSIFLLDYRGYGGSGGRPTEDGLRRDAEAAAAWLEAQGRKDVVYFGESLGCGVAVSLAASRPPRGLVLQSGTWSLVPVAQRTYPFIPFFVLLRDRFDVREAASQVTCPSLSIHGDRDEIVAYDLGQELSAALAGPTAFMTVEGAGHNDVVGAAGPVYYARVHAFLTGLDDQSRSGSE